MVRHHHGWTRILGTENLLPCTLLDLFVIFFIKIRGVVDASAPSINPQNDLIKNYKNEATVQETVRIYT